MPLTLIPFLKDYKSIKEVKEDFEANHDFVIATMMHPYSGKPANKRDLKGAGETEVHIRYDRLRKITAVKF